MSLSQDYSEFCGKLSHGCLSKIIIPYKVPLASASPSGDQYVEGKALRGCQLRFFGQGLKLRTTLGDY